MNKSDLSELTAQAQHFKEFGTYTKYKPGTLAYRNYWREQRKRSLEGYHFGRDYVSGYNYFHLNYSPIWKIKYDKNAKIDEEGGLIGNRIFTFPDYWDGQQDYFLYLDEAEKRGEHGAVIKTRTRGYSFVGGSMCNRNYFLIPGSKSYTIAEETAYLTDDGILTKAWEIMDFIDANTAWAKRRQVANTQMHRRASYKAKVRGVDIEKGFKSDIMGISTKNNPDRPRGKRGKLALIEEGGKQPNGLRVWNTMLSSFEQGDVTFGLMIIFGTGGSEDSDFLALDTLFYNPKGYKIHAVTNKWEPGRDNTECGFFHPEYMNMEGFMDDFGNSKIEEAKVEIERLRKIKRENVKNPEDYIRYIAERPIKPSEATMRIGGTAFPVNDLREALAELETNKKLRDSVYIGKLVVDGENGIVKWRADNSVRPIVDFPLKGSKQIEGGIVLFEQPYRDSSGNIPNGRYLASTDPYNQDVSTTDSLGSTFVLDKITDRIVAEYTGRPALAETYYENVRKLMIYYNAVNNYENDVRGIFGYFSNRNSLHLLADTPRIIYDKVEDKRVLSRGKGTPGTEPINIWGRQLARTWLLTKISKNSEILILQKIRSIPLLKELIYWNNKKGNNFDRVSALEKLMILREDRMKINVEEESKVLDIAQHEFWNRSFNQDAVFDKFKNKYRNEKGNIIKAI